MARGSWCDPPWNRYPAESEVLPQIGPVKGIDRAFSLHAGLSLLWLVTSYIQTCHIRNPKYHKYFGNISALALFAHVFGALNSVYTDVVRHTALPKIFFFNAVADSLNALCIVITVARRKRQGWQQTHTDFMVKCFLSSISGAGPIRTVAQIEEWLECGPIPCQNKTQIKAGCFCRASDFLRHFLPCYYPFDVAKDGGVYKPCGP